MKLKIMYVATKDGPPLSWTGEIDYIDEERALVDNEYLVDEAETFLYNKLIDDWMEPVWRMNIPLFKRDNIAKVWEDIF